MRLQDVLEWKRAREILVPFRIHGSVSSVRQFESLSASWGPASVRARPYIGICHQVVQEAAVFGGPYKKNCIMEMDKK